MELQLIQHKPSLEIFFRSAQSNALNPLGLMFGLLL